MRMKLGARVLRFGGNSRECRIEPRFIEVGIVLDVVFRLRL